MSTLNEGELEKLSPNQKAAYLAGDRLAQEAWAKEYRNKWDKGLTPSDTNTIGYTGWGMVVLGVAAIAYGLFANGAVSSGQGDVVNLGLMANKLFAVLCGCTATIIGTLCLLDRK